MHIKSIFLFVILISQLAAISQKQTTEQYIERWKDEAIAQMQAHKIPASITLAQGILESGNGNSMLAQKANNHFGIKCHSSWQGKKVYKDDDRKNECFRKYKTASESFNDHADFLKKKRYAPLFELKLTDYKGWAKGLKKAGYATNPKYPKLLIGLVERYNLNQYDKPGDYVLKHEDIKKEDVLVAATSEEPVEIVVINKKHSVKTTENKIKYITVKDGDTFTKLANEFDMRLWQLHKYNDFNKNHVLKTGERVYLKPKRGKAIKEYHFVKKGETMHSISQFYGLKLKRLHKKNQMIIGAQPTVGQKLYLRKKKK